MNKLICDMTINTKNNIFAQNLKAGKAKYKEITAERRKLKLVEETVEKIYIDNLQKSVTTVICQDANGNLRYFFKDPEKIIVQKDRDTFLCVSELGFIHDNIKRIDVTTPTLAIIEKTEPN